MLYVAGDQVTTVSGSTVGQKIRGLLKCGKISNFCALDIDLHTTCTVTTKYLIFVDKTPVKSMKIFIPRKFLALRYILHI